jgi:hypothetical protein
MTPQERDEYKALRATIRERGTARVWILVIGLAVWCGLALAAAAATPAPAATLLPLLVLAAVFEAVCSLHTGVERIGRYIQVFHEPDGAGVSARWEHVAMAAGAGTGGGDPLFTPLFALAALANLLPAVLAGALPVEWTTIGTFHVLFVCRLFLAKQSAAGQRARDLERFDRIRKSLSAREGDR